MPGNEQNVRTCVGCREKAERDALLRFVIAGDPPQVVPDVSRRANGRGASVHPRRRCLELALRNGALRRALRTDVVATADELTRWALGQYGRRVDGLLSAAHRSGHLAVGSERVKDAIAGRRAALLVVAGDATANRQEMMRAAERLGGSCLVHGDVQSLGRLLGRETVAVVAITDREIAAAVQTASRCADEITAGAEEGTGE